MPSIIKNIEPFLEELNDAIKKKVVKLVYKLQCSKLRDEMNRCVKEFETYNKELNSLRSEYTTLMSKKNKLSRNPPENIRLNIEEKEDQVRRMDEDPVKEEEDESEADESEADESEEEESEEEESEEEESEEEESEAAEDDQAKQTEAEADESEAAEDDQAKQTEAEKDESEEDSDNEEVFEIEIDDVTYYATNEENGPLYNCDENGDPGNKVGYLKDGEPFFY
jgi:type IV secretory pathway VirB10-like protein